MSTRARFANFVIGGTEKAGTTSVFNYLAAHPQVCASSRKETDFFREAYTGDLLADARRYESFFERCDPLATVIMEASPGYLGEAAIVAPRLQTLVPDAKLLFILRHPIDRLYSSYHFHRGKLNLPQEMSFDDYVGRCMEFDRKVKPASELALDEWYLKVLRFGCYAEFIEIFRARVPADRIKVMFFEALRDDEHGFMVELSAFLGIDAGFWSQFEFRKSNVTFSARNRTLHKIAMKVNAIAEPLMRRYPQLKHAIVGGYKAFNQEREGYELMHSEVRARLVDFYRPSISALQQQLGSALPKSWHDLAASPAT